MTETFSECFASANGMTICYETFGDPAERPLLLVMGLSGPMIWWEDGLCRMLADRGFYVIRYDNRDCGRSTHLRAGVQVRPLQAYLRITTTYLGVSDVAYTLDDMADDAAGLLDHLGIDAAHVTGVSMGGMIAQTMAIRHPERVLSLVSIASTTGNRFVGQPSPYLLPLLRRRVPYDRERYIAYALRIWRHIGSPGYPFDAERIRRLATDAYDRGFNPAGLYRQLAAIVSSCDRTQALGQVQVPALVIHGSHDRLVRISGGKATARALPGAKLLVLPGMGHDLQVELWPVFVHGIEQTAKATLAA